MKLKIKLNQDFFFFLAYFLFIMQTMLSRSMFYYGGLIPDAFNTAIRIVVIFLSIFKIVVCDKYSLRKFVLYCLIIASLTLTFLESERSVLLVKMLLILSAYKINFKKIVKMDFVFMLFWTCIIVLSSLTGIIDNTYYSGRGYAYGFYYFSYLGLIAYALTGLYFIVRDYRCGYLELIAIAAINYIVYIQCGSRTPFILSIALIVAYILVVKLRLLSFASRTLKLAATILPIICYGLLYGFIYLYQVGALTAFERSDTWRTMILRITNTLAAVELSGIKLFGQNYSYNVRGSYLDSGFVYTIVVYGVVFTIVLMGLYVLLFRYLLIKQEKYLVAWLIITFFGCFSTELLLDLLYNPMVFLIPMAIEGFQGGIVDWNEERRKKKRLIVKL